MGPRKDADIDGIDPLFFEGLTDEEGFDEEAANEIFLSLEPELEKEDRLLGWFRSLPSGVRFFTGVVVSLLLVAVVGLFMPGHHVAMMPFWRLATMLSAISVLLVASVWFSLRPLHRPPTRAGLEVGLVGLALISLFALAYLPLADPMPDAPKDWAHASMCLFAGLVLCIPAYIVIRLLDRGGRQSSALLAATASALAANAALAMHCENTSIEHTLKGHAMIGVVFVGAIALWRWVMNQLRSP